MTFYNVISGILFLAACQSFLATLGTRTMWVAATLVITLLNESILTSDLIERSKDPIPYKLEMKLLDFVTFAVMLWALLIISPSPNALNVDVSQTLWGANDPRWFWALLTAYWGLTLAWNCLAGQLNSDSWHPKFIWWMKSMWVPPLVVLVATHNNSAFSSLPPWTGIFTLILVSAYLTTKLVAKRTQ